MEIYLVKTGGKKDGREEVGAKIELTFPVLYRNEVVYAFVAVELSNSKATIQLFILI